ncbi:MAG: hypothetical protein AB7K24_24905 [Gemmataceae bacterium]
MAGELAVALEEKPTTREKISQSSHSSPLPTGEARTQIRWKPTEFCRNPSWGQVPARSLHSHLYNLEPELSQSRGSTMPITMSQSRVTLRPGAARLQFDTRNKKWVLSNTALEPPRETCSCCVGQAKVKAGPRLGTIDTAQLLNQLLGSLAGTSLDLSVSDWNALAKGSVGSAGLVDALQTELAVSNPDEALTANSTLYQIFAAAAAAVRADGDTLAVDALDSLALNVISLTDPVKLGNFLEVHSAYGSVGLLDLVAGSIELYNHDQVAGPPVPMMMNGAALGFADAEPSSVKFRAQVVKSPLIVAGEAGTKFHASAVRMQLALDWINTGIDDSELSHAIKAALGGTADVTVDTIRETEN